MKLANLRGRATIITEDGGIDVARASRDRFPTDPQALFDRWEDFRDWAESARLDPTVAVTEAALGPPAPAPRQVFGIGMNYRAHAAEAGLPIPDSPATFTKFPTCLTGPAATVELPSMAVDWEVELVVAIGRQARRVDVAAAWSHVAGIMVGQDLSERIVQWAGGGQFSLGKSFPGFGPIGPWLTTPDELSNPDDLELGCSIDGETVQCARTSDMVFSVSRLIAELSAILPLLPGDLIFTGTPAGIGATRKPPRFLKSGEVLTSWIEGLGTIRTQFVAAG